MCDCRLSGSSVRPSSQGYISNRLPAREEFFAFLFACSQLKLLGPRLCKMLAEQVDHTLGCGIVEKPFEVLRSLPRKFFASRKEVVFIGGKCGFDLMRTGDERSSQLRAIIHSEVGTFTCERRHEVRRITEQGYAWHPIPSMFDRESIDRSKYWIDFGIRDEGGQLRSPSFELRSNAGQTSFCVPEIDGSDPVFRLI